MVARSYLVGRTPSSVMLMGNAIFSDYLSHTCLLALTREWWNEAVDRLACVGLWDTHCSCYTSQYDVMTVDVDDVVVTVNRYHADGGFQIMGY